MTSEQRRFLIIGYALAQRRMKRELDDTSARLEATLDELRGEISGFRGELHRLRAIDAAGMLYRDWNALLH